MQILEWGREALHKLVNYYVGTTIIDATTLISYISKKVGGGGGYSFLFSLVIINLKYRFQNLISKFPGKSFVKTLGRAARYILPYFHDLFD